MRRPPSPLDLAATSSRPPSRGQDAAPAAEQIGIRHRLEYAAYSAAKGLIRTFGLDMGSRLGGLSWRLVGPLTPRRKQVAANLALAFPEKSPAERRRIARAMWDNLGRVMAEAFQIERLVAEPERIAFDGSGIAPIVDEMRRGAVIVSLHMGNWEIAAWPAIGLRLNSAGVYRPIDNPLIDADLAAARRRIFPAGLFGKGETASARQIFGHVRRGNCIAILGDLREFRGVVVPFFGRPATATPVPALIARTLKVPLVAGRSIRQGGVRFRVEAVPIPVPVTEDRDADVLAATAALHRQFEAWIREHPEQWLWVHDKWAERRRPGRRQRRMAGAPPAVEADR